MVLQQCPSHHRRYAFAAPKRSIVSRRFGAPRVGAPGRTRDWVVAQYQEIHKSAVHAKDFANGNKALSNITKMIESEQQEEAPAPEPQISVSGSVVFEGGINVTVEGGNVGDDPQAFAEAIAVSIDSKIESKLIEQQRYGGYLNPRGG